MQAPIAWIDNEWKPLGEIGLGLNDWGILQGAIIVDRLRTIGLQPLHAKVHTARFLANCQAIGIYPGESEQLLSLVNECAERNRDAYGGLDFSIVMLATPGSMPDPGQQPTCVIHTAPIRWQSLASWYTCGQSLLIASPRNVPAACWSPGIKSRSRLHYFLADQQARRTIPESGAVLLDLNEHLTETSIANLLLVEGRVLVSPKLAGILKGISLQMTFELARRLGLRVVLDDISASRAADADELLLCGSSGCLWPASSLAVIESEDRPYRGLRVFDAPHHLQIYNLLKDAWTQELGWDFVKQALLASENSEKRR